MEEALGKLLFELSNQERRQILSELKTSKLGISQIAKKLGIAVAEASRHLQRLSDEKLITKNSNNTYKLTQLGEITLSSLSKLRFLSKQKDFLLQYDLSDIPYDFINRIGELEQGQYINETLPNLDFAEKRFLEAEKYIWILSDHILKSAVPIISDKIKDKNFEVRLLLPEAVMPKEENSKVPLTMQGVQKRTLPQIKTIVLATENYATFAVPTLNGKMDYTGFNSDDERFRKWCQDLFNYYWDRAKSTRKR